MNLSNSSSIIAANDTAEFGAFYLYLCYCW